MRRLAQEVEHAADARRLAREGERIGVDHRVPSPRPVDGRGAVGAGAAGLVRGHDRHDATEGRVRRAVARLERRARRVDVGEPRVDAVDARAGEVFAGPLGEDEVVDEIVARVPRLDVELALLLESPEVRVLLLVALQVAAVLQRIDGRSAEEAHADGNRDGLVSHPAFALLEDVAEFRREAALRGLQPEVAVRAVRARLPGEAAHDAARADLLPLGIREDPDALEDGVVVEDELVAEADAGDRAFRRVAVGMMRRLLERQAVGRLVHEDLHAEELAEDAVLVGGEDLVGADALPAVEAEAADLAVAADIARDPPVHVLVAQHAEAPARIRQRQVARPFVDVGRGIGCGACEVRAQEGEGEVFQTEAHLSGCPFRSVGV